MDFRLQQMVASWKKTNPAPDRVKPIPIQVIKQVAILAQHATSQQIKAVSDMIIIAFFLVLRPGEYTDNNDNPIRLEDVQLFIGQNRLNLLSATDAQLLQTRFASPTFTDQKNGSLAMHDLETHFSARSKQLFAESSTSAQMTLLPKPHCQECTTPAKSLQNSLLKRFVTLSCTLEQTSASCQQM